MKFRIVAYFAATLLLAGCQTPYQDMGATGGVAATPLTNDIYRISARGNGFTDPTTVQDYVLLKAAETTMAAGHTHFAVMQGTDATSVQRGQTAGYFNTSVYGNTAYTTYNPGMSYDIVKPGQDLIIQVGTLPAGTQTPFGIFDARQIYDNINPRVLRPKAPT